MELFLDRYSYALSETEGILSIADFELATMERPWVAGNTPGGKPFESCIPDGEYRLDPWRRPSGHEVYILSNPELGVFKEKGDGIGRYLILIHVANWVINVVGCIGPGTSRSIMKNPSTGRYERAVSSSGEAMRIITEQLGREESHTLTIRSKSGTGGVR